MGEQHGFTVQAYDTQPDATQAVLSGRAYATLGGNTTIVYAASKNPQFVADLELTDTRAHWAAPFPKAERSAAQPDAGRARLHEEGRHDR
jgi:polar amino acid transport system substrate-binding protein